MSLKSLKITFHLDGAGVFFDPFEPLHLDSLLSWALAPFHCKGEAPGRDDEPYDIPLPLGKWKINGIWGWHASALFPDGDVAESLQYWRKRFRQSKVDCCKQNPNLSNGPYREYNVSMPLLLCHKMTAYAFGSRKRVAHVLRKQVRFIGKKKAYGKGVITNIDVDVIDKDRSLINEGITTRYLPDKNGIRLIRPRPPYWNNVGKVKCCNVGDRYEKT